MDEEQGIPEGLRRVGTRVRVCPCGHRGTRHRGSYGRATRATKGNFVDFIHQGVTFKVIPDKPADKLSSTTPLYFINPDYNLESSEAELQAEMEREWEKDWSEL
jgi:hypothetical protein